MSALAEAFNILRSALESTGARYAIGGSWASAAFGEARSTNDLDVLADLTTANLDYFFKNLPTTFYSDPDTAKEAIAQGRPFNVIYIPMAFKFDIFPARSFPLGLEELDRAVMIPRSGLSEIPTPFVTPEDILLAKLHWYSSGGQVSEVQWRDIQAIIHSRGATLDRRYLEHGAAKLGISRLLVKALSENRLT